MLMDSREVRRAVCRVSFLRQNHRRTTMRLACAERRVLSSGEDEPGRNERLHGTGCHSGVHDVKCR
jgi:hypothetical protein